MPLELAASRKRHYLDAAACSTRRQIRGGSDICYTQVLYSLQVYHSIFYKSNTWVPTIHVVLHEDTDGLDASAVKIKLVICSLPPMSESLFEDVE